MNILLMKTSKFMKMLRESGLLLQNMETLNLTTNPYLFYSGSGGESDLTEEFEESERSQFRISNLSKPSTNNINENSLKLNYSKKNKAEFMRISSNTNFNKKLPEFHSRI